MLQYLELAPPARLADSVECLWISQQTDSTAAWQRVLPDGCADVIYTRAANRGTLRFVGPMTRFQDFAQDADFSVGVRFRPALWSQSLNLDADGSADRIVPLEDCWGRSASTLLSLLETTDEPLRLARLLCQTFPDGVAGSALQKAIIAMERSRGRLCVSEAASKAGLSIRQFRRGCLNTTGLSPKLLARILRFRYAHACAAARKGHHAELAVECGYADQSHLIAECRHFAGHIPWSL